MKKIFSLILTCAIVLSCVAVGAVECEHSYVSQRMEASCIEKAHILYTCSFCADTYKRYADDPEIGDEFYVLAVSDREDDILHVRVSIGNNPGLFGARLYVKYNADTLKVDSVNKGNLLNKGDYFSVNLEKNPLSIYTESPLVSTESQCNTNNGVFFDAYFEIIDPKGDYGISIYYTRNGDFVGLDFASGNASPAMIKYNPVVINIVGESELGDCVYESSVTPPTCTDGGFTTETCLVCGGTYTHSNVDPLGHDYVLTQTLVAPDLDNDGEGIYTCLNCGDERTMLIPVLVRYAKGDLDNDTRLTAKDVNLLARVVVGILGGIQIYDAGDLLEDGVVNAKDVNLLKQRLLHS